MTLGTAQQKMVDDMRFSTFGDSFWDSAKNNFYKANGLGILTTIWKRLDALIRADHYISASRRWATGNESDFDRAYLLRYNITKDHALRISKLIDDKVIQQSDRGLWLANTKAWDDIELRDTFSKSMSSGILNTIIMGTPADKPKIVDGVVLIKTSTVQRAGLGGILKEHKDYPGYVKLEKHLAFMALPFQFYAYSMGALTSITGAFSQGALKSRVLPPMIGLGLAYFSIWLRTPSWRWEEMEWQDKMARSFEYSGLAAIHSDLFYESMHTILSLSGKNITGGFLQPKFTEDTLETAIGLGGAGPSYGYDVVDGIYDMYQGDFGRGAGLTLKNIPYFQIFYVKGLVNDWAYALDRRFD